MIPFFDSLRDINVLSVSVRMLLAVICGGVIGIERVGAEVSETEA